MLFQISKIKQNFSELTIKYSNTKKALDAVIRTSCNKDITIDKLRVEMAELTAQLQLLQIPSNPFTLIEFSLQFAADQLEQLEKVPLKKSKDTSFVKMVLEYLFDLNELKHLKMADFEQNEKSKYRILLSMFRKRVSHLSQDCVDRASDKYYKAILSRELYRYRKSNRKENESES